MTAAISRFLLLASLPLAASTVEFGTLRITQLANNNDTLASATPGIAITHGPGSSPGGNFQSSANRGDYNLDFGQAADTATGVLLSSVAQLSRNDSATGGPAPGDFHATSSLAFSTTTSKYWIALHWAEAADNVEVNHDVSYAFLPYDCFLGGVATNTVNNGPLTQFTGSPGIALGTQFTDLESPAGQYRLDLAPLVSNASQNGVLLVTGARNEDNFALSRANADGSFEIFCHDSGANGSNHENDGVGFSYLPASAAGTDRLVALGRVRGDASTEASGGNFAVTKGPTGRWFLEIPGHSEATGTLIVSPEGGDANNSDNIVAAAWDPANGRWIIESRDLTGIAAQAPALQNMARADEDAFSFAFFSVGSSQPPAIAAAGPADDSIRVPVAATLSATVTDPDSTPLRVTFHGRRVGTVDSAPDFTVVALPDTQFYSENTGGDRAAIFSAQTDWIVAENDARNIGFVLHLGDITQNGDNPATALTQWTNAANAMYRLENPATTLLDDGIPYVMAVGNHDQTPIGDADGSTTGFNTWFGVHPATGINHFNGKSYYGGTSEPTKADNHYTLFSAGGLDFIVISLEYDTTQDVADLDWADALLKAHPHRRGIVITHYLVRSGNPAPFGPQGQAIYDSLKDNPNLILMHGGHIHGEGRRSDTFEGRTVHSLLADYQGRSNGGDGWLRLLKFRPALNRIEIETYSPTLDHYETDADSRFSLDVPLDGGIGPFTEIGSLTLPPGTASIPWPALEPGTRYEWYATVHDGSTTVATPVRSFITDGVLFPPVVELTGPPNGTIAASPANIVLQATATDLDGNVTKVSFFSGATLLGEDLTAPYSFAWNNVSAGSYTIIAKATDNDGQTSSAAPVFVQITTEPAPPDPSTVSSGVFLPAWLVATSSPSPRQFDSPGSNPGDIALKINAVNVPFLGGIVAATGFDDPANGTSTAADNLTLPYAGSNGAAWISTLDNSDPNAADANPTTAEESTATAAAFLPYAAGWTGASASADGTILAGNLPPGVEIRRSGDGLYTLSGLAPTGNLLAFANGNGGLDGDNVISVRNSGGQWLVETRDNSSDPQNGAFSFVHIPAATPRVFSGLILSDGSFTPLNAELSSLGATVLKTSSHFEITLGDGAVFNPTTCALFLTGDTSRSLAAADNLVSYSAAGNAFRIFSQDLPQLAGTFQATDIRFLIIPFDLPALPQVNISASDPAGGEFGADRQVAFTVTRSGSTAAPLQVAYTTGGTATSALDYPPLFGLVEIPAGQTSATISATVLSDSLLEGDETLVLTLAAAATYQPGPSPSASATLHDRPLQAYLKAAGLAAPEADDDLDGISNLLEYYFGSDASDPASRSILTAESAANGTFTARFPHAKSATDVQPTVQWSIDLANWYSSGQSNGTHIADIVTYPVSPPEEDPETLRATLTIRNGPLPPAIYLRLSVQP
jgi:hypothetical protein